VSPAQIAGAVAAALLTETPAPEAHGPAVWAILLGAAGALVTFAGAATVLWWLVAPRVIAWARREITEPLRETHQQVATNHHTAAVEGREPTLPDRLDDLTTVAMVIHARVSKVAQEQTRLRDDFNKHVHGSATNGARAERQLEEIRETFADTLQTFAEANRLVWPAIEAVAKATPPADD